MQQVTVKDKDFQVFITESELISAISKMALILNEDLKGKKPLFIAVLNGAFMFASELFKKVDFDCEISFVKYGSYHGVTSSGQVKTIIGCSEDLKDRTVVLLEDIIDSGLTMEKVLADVKSLNPASVKIATMLFKPNAFKGNYQIDYIAMNIPNDFIVGFGLDYDGFGRNLKDIYKLIE
jgi:hypoxanthine phosphoribosyltransferase